MVPPQMIRGHLPLDQVSPSSMDYLTDQFQGTLALPGPKLAASVPGVCASPPTRFHTVLSIEEFLVSRSLSDVRSTLPFSSGMAFNGGYPGPTYSNAPLSPQYTSMMDPSSGGYSSNGTHFSHSGMAGGSYSPPSHTLSPKGTATTSSINFSTQVSEYCRVHITQAIALSPDFPQLFVGYSTETQSKKVSKPGNEATQVNSMCMKPVIHI